MDELLLRHHAHLNALMRRVRQRIHDRQPVDKLAEKGRMCILHNATHTQEHFDRVRFVYYEILPE